MNKEPDSWITINGQHVPIFEGEGKREATQKFLNKKMSRVQKNLDKYDTITKYKKRKATNKVDEKPKPVKKLIQKGNTYIPVREDEDDEIAIKRYKDTYKPQNEKSLTSEQRRQGLIDFTQNNREQIKEWQKDFDDDAVSEKVLSGKELTLKEYYGVLGRAPREGDVILAGGRNGEDVRVGKNGKLEIINKFKKRKSSNK